MILHRLKSIARYTMLLSYYELARLVESGAIRGSDLSQINGTSIDVRLSGRFLRERVLDDPLPIVDVAARESPQFNEILLASEKDYLTIAPREFVLAATEEVFFLPPNISALFVMKSSVARCGLDQLNAAWCSPGWTGSALTLELMNVTQFHYLKLRPGMPIGQMVFFRSAVVPVEKLYKNRGAFNNQPTVAKSDSTT